MKPTILLAIIGLAAASPALAQSNPAPYAGQQTRAIKALSDADAKALLEGAGMGFAKAAELNGYPGPMHVLENAAALDVDEVQRAAIRAILERHKAEARALGAEVVKLEAELDALFAARTASAANIGPVLARIGEVSARLRASHLEAHLATTKLLSREQVAHYAALRGYGEHAHHGSH